MKTALVASLMALCLSLSAHADSDAIGKVATHLVRHSTVAPEKQMEVYHSLVKTLTSAMGWAKSASPSQLLESIPANPSLMETILKITGGVDADTFLPRVDNSFDDLGRRTQA